MRKSTTPFLISLFSLLTLGGFNAAAIPEDWLQISNGPQCAVDMKKPTQSIFLAVSFRDMALVLQELAPQIKQPTVPFIQEGNRIFKLKLTSLSDKIIKGLDSGELPLLTQKNDAAIAKSWENLNLTAPAQNIEDLKCYQVNDINSYYSHLFIRGVNASTLEELAKQYKSGKSRINGCNVDNIEANADFYPVFNYDIKIKNTRRWDEMGFDFWAAYKIYLSWAWRNTNINEGVYRKAFKSIPIEEQIVLLSNGCKSLNRPECSSDFLSSTELRQLFTLDRKKLDLTSSTLEMKDNLIDNNDTVDQKAQEQLSLKSAENEWIRSFQKAYMGFTQAHKEKLSQANKVMSSLATQVGVKNFIDDLTSDFQNKKKSEQFYYFCSEARLIGQEKPLSVFKFDLDFIKQHGSKLNESLQFGLNVEEMIGLYESMAPTMIDLCNRFDASLKDRPEIKEDWTGYRPWYKSYLSRYKILKQFLDLDEEEKKQRQLEQSSEQNYVKGLCADAVDCGRKMIEGVVNINKVLLHSKTFLRSEFVTAPLFNERAEKVACGIYDPWEATKLNNKKLMADLGSSILFGWTSLPIYLDVNFKPKELVSLNKLIEGGQVKFDPTFDSGSIKKNLSVNFGSLLNVPCSVSVSQTKNQELGNAPFVFNGLSVTTCQSTKHDSLLSPNKQVDTFKKAPETDRSLCGQCAISFSQLAPIALTNAYAPLRFIIRVAESLIRYVQVKNDDTINPRQFNINSKYLVEAYDRFHSIPNQCVGMLTRGLKCQANMCEALAVKEFEMKTGLEVESVSLTEKQEVGHETFDGAYFKVKGCAKEIRIPMKCVGNGDAFFMYIQNGATKSCKTELLK